MYAVNGTICECRGATEIGVLTVVNDEHVQVLDAAKALLHEIGLEVVMAE